MKELKCIKESVKTDHCKYVKWIALLFRDLNEIGALLGTKEDERLTVNDYFVISDRYILETSKF
jgi:hypothetical protein